MGKRKRAEVTRIVPTADGRLIEITEGVIHKKPPRNFKKVEPPKPNIWPDHRRPFKRSRKKRVKYRNPATKGKNNPISIMMATLPGFTEWYSLRRDTITKLTHKGIAPGSVKGMRTPEWTAAWAEARRQAEADMEIIKTKIDLSAAAEEALTEALVVMRGPTAATKLAAAKLVLDFTMAKPVSKSEVTVNAAEAWLESIKED